LEQMKSWSTHGVDGVYRFLARVWRAIFNQDARVKEFLQDRKPTNEELRLLHELIKKVTDDLDRMSFNTAISAFMIFLNQILKMKSVSKEIIESFLTLLSPFAPHICEEIWEKLGHDRFIVLEKWPVFDSELIKKESIEIVIQVNGKLRSKIRVPVEITEDALKSAALKDEKVAPHVEGKEIKKVVIVPKRLVNVVAV